MNEQKSISVQNLVRYSLLATLAAMCQVSGSFFPGPGYVLSAFSTLPVAMAAYINPVGGIYCAVVASWLTFMLQPVEVIWLLLNTAPLGLVIGAGLHWSWRPQLIVLAGTFTLTSAMLFTTYILGIPSFGKIVDPARIWLVITVFAGFSAVYAFAWLRFIRKFVRRLERFLNSRS